MTFHVQGLHGGVHGNARTKPASTDHGQYSAHRPTKEFANDHKHVREWCQCYSTLKGQTRGVLGKRHRLRCGQPLLVDLDHQVSGGQEKRTVCIYNITMSKSRRGLVRGGIFAR